MQTLTGSYSPDDVVFLLKDLSDTSLERSLDEREEAIQGGVHYSEMLEVQEEQPCTLLFPPVLNVVKWQSA